MALSDEILRTPERLSAVRSAVEKLTVELGAPAGFLVDEAGTPFAAVGHVEFGFPNPWSELPEGDMLLAALLGETGAAESPYVVARAGRRALLALVLRAPVTSAQLRAVRRRVKRRAAEIAELL